MIRSWRKSFASAIDAGDDGSGIPFVFVQIGGYARGQPPHDQNMTAIRFGQSDTLAVEGPLPYLPSAETGSGSRTSVSNTGMAVTYDLGNPSRGEATGWSIHSLHKLEIGRRVALQLQH